MLGRIGPLSYLIASFLQAQIGIGLAGGAQLYFERYSYFMTYINSGVGLFGGMCFYKPLTDRISLGAEGLVSWGQIEESWIEEAASRRIFYERVTSHIFFKQPLTVRYMHRWGKFAVEGAVGIQPFLWLGASFRQKETVTAYTSGSGPVSVYSEVTRRGTSFEEPPEVYGRSGIAAVVMAGARLSKVGAYLRYDPMLGSLRRDFRYGQSSLGLMLTYWFSAPCEGENPV